MRAGFTMSYNWITQLTKLNVIAGCFNMVICWYLKSFIIQYGNVMVSKSFIIQYVIMMLSKSFIIQYGYIMKCKSFIIQYVIWIFKSFIIRYAIWWYVRVL